VSSTEAHGYNVKALRLQCWKRQRGHCYFCDALTLLPQYGLLTEPLTATLEHLDRADDWHGSNLVCSCIACKRKRDADRREPHQICGCGNPRCNGMRCQRATA
jgi:hypothetical protein